MTVIRHLGGTSVVVPTCTRIGCCDAMLTRNVCAPRLAAWFQRSMHEAVVTWGVVGGVAPGVVDCVVVVVAPLAGVVAPVVVVVPVVALLTTAELLPLSLPKIKSA